MNIFNSEFSTDRVSCELDVIIKVSIIKNKGIFFIIQFDIALNRYRSVFNINNCSVHYNLVNAATLSLVSY